VTYNSVGLHTDKNQPHILALLVFAETLANPKKPKELKFSHHAA
jgi:hypothetical protein